MVNIQLGLMVGFNDEDKSDWLAKVTGIDDGEIEVSIICDGPENDKTEVWRISEFLENVTDKKMYIIGLTGEEK